MIIHATITALVCVGIHNVLTADGMIFKWLGDFIDSVVEINWIKKPLYQCLPCMASVWGSASYLYYYHGHDVVEFIIFVVIVSGLNKLFQKFIYEL